MRDVICVPVHVACGSLIIGVFLHLCTMASTVMRLAFEDSNATAVTLRREQSMYVIIPSACHEK